MGVFRSAGAVEHPVEKSDVPVKAIQFQAYRTVSGTGGQLGLVLRKDQKRAPSGQGLKPVRLHRRRYGRRCRCRCERDTR